MSYAILTFRVHREDGQYVSECIELGVASCGDSLDDAFEAILDATELYLETLGDEGERERVFLERGIRLLPGEPPAGAEEISITARLREYVLPAAVRVPAVA